MALLPGCSRDLPDISMLKGANHVFSLLQRRRRLAYERVGHRSVVVRPFWPN